MSVDERPSIDQDMRVEQHRRTGHVAVCLDTDVLATIEDRVDDRVDVDAAPVRSVSCDGGVARKLGMVSRAVRKLDVLRRPVRYEDSLIDRILGDRPVRSALNQGLRAIDFRIRPSDLDNLDVRRIRNRRQDDVRGSVWSNVNGDRRVAGCRERMGPVTR